MGRGPKASNKNVLQLAPQEYSAASRLAATGLLTSSAIKATCSPARTARQVSAAFFAPSINSDIGLPKQESIFPFYLKAGAELTSEAVLVPGKHGK